MTKLVGIAYLNDLRSNTNEFFGAGGWMPALFEAQLIPAEDQELHQRQGNVLPSWQRITRPAPRSSAR